jgi:hypothetical protein
MKTRNVLLLSLFLLTTCAFSQLTNPLQVPDSVKIQTEMPKLEIPEITIVGKKAITLPFARKGEIYDVELFDAPPVDSSILLERPSQPFPVGQYNKYEERYNPWRFSVEGLIGSFATTGADGYADYKSDRWDFAGMAGFKSTPGRSIDNKFAVSPSSMDADANNVHAEVNLRSLLPTDNDILKTLRFTLGAKFMGDEYHYFGGNGIETKRDRQNSFLSAGLESVNRQGTVVDFNLSVNNWNLNDTKTGRPDSEVSLVSPKIKAGFATDIGTARFVNELEYTGSSLNYQHSTQSPSCMNLFSGLKLRVSDEWSLQAGAYYGYGSASDGGSKTILLPSASMGWDIDLTKKLTLFWKPELQMASYGRLTGENPFLDREIALRPRRTPVNVGASFWLNEPDMTFEVQGSFRQSSNYGVTLSKNGEMTIAYIDAVESMLEFNGSFLPNKSLALTYSGIINRAVPDSGDTQLPMVPLVALHAAGEVGFTFPMKMYVSGDYTSPRNIDPLGNDRLVSTFTMGTGISSNIIKKAVISLDVANLLNTSYFLWDGYPAPGVDITIRLKYNIQ